MFRASSGQFWQHVPHLRYYPLTPFLLSSPTSTHIPFCTCCCWKTHAVFGQDRLETCLHDLVLRQAIVFVLLPTHQLFQTSYLPSSVVANQQLPYFCCKIGCLYMHFCYGDIVLVRPASVHCFFLQFLTFLICVMHGILPFPVMFLPSVPSLLPLPMAGRQTGTTFPSPLAASSGTGLDMTSPLHAFPSLSTFTSHSSPPSVASLSPLPPTPPPAPLPPPHPLPPHLTSQCAVWQPFSIVRQASSVPRSCTRPLGIQPFSSPKCLSFSFLLYLIYSGWFQHVAVVVPCLSVPCLAWLCAFACMPLPPPLHRGTLHLESDRGGGHFVCRQRAVEQWN